MGLAGFGEYPWNCTVGIMAVLKGSGTVDEIAWKVAGKGT